MYAEESFRGLPSFSLAFYKVVDAFATDKFQVFNLTHAIFCPVSFIQSFQPITWKLDAIEAIPAFTLLTNSNSAENAGFQLMFFSFSASMASVFLPQMPYANSAVHSTRSD
jgi:hypothetical protein